MIRVTFYKIDYCGSEVISERMISHIPSKGDIVYLAESHKRFEVDMVTHHISDDHTVDIHLTSY